MTRQFMTALALLCLMTVSSCNGKKNGEDGKVVLLETTEGNIRIRLFDDTPGHRDNFIQNVKDGMYDGVTFHRVIRNFMIQTGDPYTRKGVEPADTTQPSPMIPAEIRYPQHYHKRCMVAAAREGDDVNPQKKSDKYQFYIVTGKNYSDEALHELESNRYDLKVEEKYNEYVKQNEQKIDALRRARDRERLSDFLDSLLTKAKYYVTENPPAETPKQVARDYRVYGGAPFLDGDYTVFGEVIEGMKIVETIEKTKTDANDKPFKEIRITKATVEE